MLFYTGLKPVTTIVPLLSFTSDTSNVSIFLLAFVNLHSLFALTWQKIANKY